MCEDYWPLNHQTKFDWYAMAFLEEIFDAIWHAKVFNMLD